MFNQPRVIEKGSWATTKDGRERERELQKRGTGCIATWDERSELKEVGKGIRDFDFFCFNSQKSGTDGLCAGSFR